MPRGQATHEGSVAAGLGLYQCLMTRTHCHKQEDVDAGRSPGMTEHRSVLLNKIWYQQPYLRLIWHSVRADSAHARLRWGNGDAAVIGRSNPNILGFELGTTSTSTRLVTVGVAALWLRSR